MSATVPRHAAPSERFHLPLGAARTRGAYNNVGSREAAFGRIEYMNLLSKIRPTMRPLAGKAVASMLLKGGTVPFLSMMPGYAVVLGKLGRAQARTQRRLAKEEPHSPCAPRKHSPQPTPKG